MKWALVPRPAGPARLQTEPLGVAPELVGRPLAGHGRRIAAMGIDLAIVALLSGSSRLWLVAGLAVLLAQLLSPRGGVPRRAQPVLGWAGALLVLVLVAAEVQQRWFTAPPAPAVAAVADLAEPAEPAASDPGARIAQLEAALERTQDRLAAAERRDKGLGHWLAVQAGEIADAFGWGIVYFSLLPAWWRGQTVGKKLLKLRVLELTGAPLTVLRCLKRYGGYAAGMATGGIGFAQVLWEPNRQGLHDKAAHTAVFDDRTPAA
ncbi:MAG: hypothetical protein Fur0014_13700 [Rubrivivax sp.]